MLVGIYRDRIDDLLVMFESLGRSVGRDASPLVRPLFRHKLLQLFCSPPFGTSGSAVGSRLLEDLPASTCQSRSLDREAWSEEAYETKVSECRIRNRW